MRHNSYFQFINKFLSLLFLLCITSGSFPVFAQTRRGTTAKKPPTTTALARTQTASDPRAGWSGVVTYTKTLSEKYDSGKVPVFGRLDKERNYSITTKTREYKYEGKLFVNGSGPEPITKATVVVSDEDREKGKMVVIDSCHAYNDQHEFIDESSKEKITKAFAEGTASGFNLYVGADNRYQLSFRFPEAKGTYTDTNSLKRSGYCQAKNNKPINSSDQFEAKEKGESFDADGLLDRNDPDVITGSKSWDESSFKITATWNFRRKAGELEIESIAFDEHPFPDFTDWRENTSGYIADSNIVRIRANIVNYSTETKFPKIEFKETKENIYLPDSEVSISIGPGETREVICIWDTSGFAWGPGFTKMQDREIMVKLTERQTRMKAKPIDIFPRPVLLVHGLWADYTAWDGYDAFLRRAYGADWKSYAVMGLNTGVKGTLKQSNTIAENAFRLEQQVYNKQKEFNAWHVDVVAHSMGGLITRYYINTKMPQVPDGKPVIQHLVMLGTPNMGSPCANLIHRTISPFGTTVKALAELDKGSVARFNEAVRYNRGVKMSNLVGMIISPTCISPQIGDGVVEWSSAVWRLTDLKFAPELHTKLTDEQYFRSYVLPRLAVTRQGNHLPAKEFALAQRRDGNGVRFTNASWNGSEEESQGFEIKAGKHVALHARQSSEIEVPVLSNGNSGITIVAPSTVSATLLDEKGTVVGKNLANSAEANVDFRYIPIDKPMNSAWKLKLENTGATEAEAIVSVWTNTSPGPAKLNLTIGKPDPSGQISLQAKLTENDAPPANASITAKIMGESNEIVLLDDGKSGDGQAGDGIFGARLNKLAGDDFVVVAKAEVNGQIVEAVAVSSPPAKPVAPAKPKARK